MAGPAARQQGRPVLLFSSPNYILMPNSLSATIPAAKLAEALDLLKQARAVLDPFLHPLTPDERQSIVKMGDKSMGFMGKLLDYATNSPTFVPAFISVAELQQDVDMAVGLAPLDQYAAQLALDLNSTVLVAGAEGMGAALPVYKNIKFMADMKQPGAQAAYDDLSQRFPGRGPAAKKPVVA